MAKELSGEKRVV